MTTRAKQRVKVYKLNAETTVWEDKGTGTACCDYDDGKDAICLIVKSEADGSTLLLTKLWEEQIYQIQRETLIVWNDPETGEDWALSFVDKKCCEDVWDQIQEIQQRLKQDDPVDLPVVNLLQIDQLYRLIKNIANNQKLSLAAALNEHSYLDQLFDLAESLERSDRRLYMFFEIFKGIVLLNDPNLLETLFSDKYILRLMGVLEFDPEVPDSKRVSHREFLTNACVWKEVIPISDELTKAKIHQTYRIKYLKDSVLLGALDDSTFTTINTLVFYNHCEILTNLQADDEFLSNLFTKLSEEKDENNLRDLVTFLQQFCELSKNLSQDERAKFFTTMVEKGLPDVFVRVLPFDDDVIQQNIIEVLGLTIGHIPMVIREHILTADPKPESPTLLGAVVTQFLHTSNVGLMGQYAEILRRLVDNDTCDSKWSSKDDYLSLIYKQLLPRVIEPLRTCEPHTHIRSMLKAQVCDFLAFCVVRHGFRIRFFLISENLVEDVLKQLNGNSPGHLKLAVIRFFRQLVGEKDRKLERHMIDKHLYDPILQLFRDNKERYNMINSAIVELFDFIVKDCHSNTKLIAYLVLRFRPDFENVKYVPTFESLIQKYESQQDALNGDQNKTSPLTRKRARDEFEKEDEEFYFEQSDEETPSTPPLIEDEEEENFKARPAPASEKDEEIAPPRLKKQKLDIKSISFHKNSVADQGPPSSE